MSAAVTPPFDQETTASPSRHTGWWIELWAAVGLGLLGMLANRFDVELVTGVSLVFGPIFSMLALLRYGLAAGLTATLLASSYTVVLFGHPWTAVLSIVELLVLWFLLLRRRIEPLTALLIYWVAGGLLSYGMHHQLVGLAHADSQLIALKQMINSTFNLLVAQMLHLLLQRYWDRIYKPIRLYVLLFYVIGMATALPVIVYVIADTRSNYRGSLQQLVADVEHAETLSVSLLRQWLSERRQIVQSAARLMVLEERGATQHLQGVLSEVLSGDGAISRLLLLDARQRVVVAAARPGIHSTLRVGQEMSQLPFAALLLHVQEPQITDLFNGRELAGFPHIALLAPLTQSKQLSGWLIAGYDLDAVQKLLQDVAVAHHTELSLLDSSGMVVASTRPELQVMQPYRTTAGSQFPVANSRVQLLMPDADKVPVPLLRRHEARYISRVRLSPAADWTVVVEAPLQPTLSLAAAKTFRVLWVLAAIILLAMLMGRLLGTWLAHPLAQLERATQNNLHEGENPQLTLYPESGVVEINRLSHHLHWMSTELNRRFNILKELNGRLEEQVAARTATLQGVMNEQQIILDNTGIGIAMITNRRLVWMNHRLYELLGYMVGDVGDEVRTVYPTQAEYERVGREAYPALDRGETYKDELQLVRRSGDLIWIRMYGKAVEPGNQASGYIWTFEDISDKKQAEQALLGMHEHLQEQVALRTAELQDSHERLKQLAGHLTVIREAERLTVARDIHDAVGSTLSAISFDIAWLERHYAYGDPDFLKRVEGMRETLQQVVAAVRRIVSELRPGMLDELGLISTIQWYLEQVAERTGLQCCLHVDKQLEQEARVLLKAHGVDIYRIVQESLTNVMRHAQASQVAVRMALTARILCLSLEDDGVGISPEALLDKQRFGIAGMRERAWLMGGSLQVIRREPCGTQVRLLIPLPVTA